MNAGFRLLTGSLAAGCLAVAVAAQPTARPRAFIQNISATDFQGWENFHELSLSSQNDLVLYQIVGSEAAPTVRAFTLKLRPGQTALLASFNARGADGKLERTDLELAPEIAGQLRASVQRLLEYNVYPPSGKPCTGSTDDYVWIFLRLTRTQAIAGVAQRSDLHQNRSEAARAFGAIREGLHEIFDGPPEERNRALTELDRATAVFAQSRLPGFEP